MAGILDWIDQNLGTRLGLLVNDPRAAMEQMNRQAGAYNQASLLAVQAERNALRGLPVTPEQAQAKQYVDKATEDIAMGFAGTTSLKPNISYRGSHTAPSPEFGAPLYDLTGGGQMYPADVYSAKAVQYYGTGYPKADREAFALAQKVKGNPDAEVTMYRAVPKDENIKSINVGDWVSLSKDYAKTHGESVLKNNYKILEKKVKAKDLWTNADSIHEFGYHPSK